MILIKENVLNYIVKTFSIRDLFGGGTSPATLCFNNLYFFILFIYFVLFIYLFIFIFLPIILFYYSLVVAALLGQSPRVVVLPT